MRYLSLLIIASLFAACGEPECQEGIQGDDGNCYVTVDGETVVVTETETEVVIVEVETEVVVTETETQVVEICRCNGITVDCDTVCEPVEVVEEYCECNGEETVCGSACEPIVEYVCALNGETVSDRSECPDPLTLVCLEGTMPFINTETGETGCQSLPPGSLNITLDGASANSTIILGASTGVAMAKYKFLAEGEAWLVRELTLVNCITNGDDNGNCADVGEVLGADDIASAVKISYQNQAGATVTKTGFLSTTNYVVFSGLDFFVPINTPKVLTVTIDTNTVDSTGATSGSQIQLNLDANNSTFEAVGVGSGEILSQADIATYINARPMTIRKTKPTIALAAGSPSGAGVPGFNEVLRFNVSADSRGFVQYDRIAFKVSNSGFLEPEPFEQHPLSFDSRWRLVDLNDPSVNLLEPFELVVQSGSEFTTIVEFRLDADQNMPFIEVAAGETRTFSVYLDTTGAGTDDYVRLDIPEEVETLNAFSLRWHDDVEATDIDGSLVKNLPIYGGTIIY